MLYLRHHVITETTHSFMTAGACYYIGIVTMLPLWSSAHKLTNTLKSHSDF